jgi:hypothetical protein
VLRDLRKMINRAMGTLCVCAFVYAHISTHTHTPLHVLSPSVRLFPSCSTAWNATKHGDGHSCTVFSHANNPLHVHKCTIGIHAWRSASTDESLASVSSIYALRVQDCVLCRCFHIRRVCVGKHAREARDHVRMPYVHIDT